MNFTLLTKIAAGITAAAAAATIVVALVPAPFVETGIWFDQPIPNAQLQPGPVVIAMHASKGRVGQFRVVIRKDGKTVKVLNDTSVTEQKSGILYGVLSSGAVEWQGTPGVYTLEPRYLSAGTWTTGDKATITVTTADGALPVSGAPTPTPKPTASDEPDPTETEEATVDDGPDPVDPPPASTPAPDEEPQMPTGSVQRNGPSDGHTSSYLVSGVAPEFVDVDVQVRSRTSGSWSSWASLGCSDLGVEMWSSPQNPTYGCIVASHTWGWSTSGRQAEVRVVITNYDDESLVYTSPTVSWSIMPDIG